MFNFKQDIWLFFHFHGLVFHFECPSWSWSELSCVAPNPANPGYKQGKNNDGGG